jgi:CRP-like cAMP-binding protein
MDLLNVFKRVELFRGLTEAQLQRLAEISQQEAYNKGEAICRQGDPGDEMYVIADGQVEIVVRDMTGESVSAVYLGEGQVVGEMALVDQGPRSATVLAVMDNTIIYSIPNASFDSLFQQDTAIGFVMMRNMAQDLSFKLRHHDSDLSGQ